MDILNAIVSFPVILIKMAEIRLVDACCYG